MGQENRRRGRGRPRRRARPLTSSKRHLVFGRDLDGIAWSIAMAFTFPLKVYVCYISLPLYFVVPSRSLSVRGMGLSAAALAALGVAPVSPLDEEQGPAAYSSGPEPSPYDGAAGPTAVSTVRE